jgi:hypothetical protein
MMPQATGTIRYCRSGDPEAKPDERNGSARKPDLQSAHVKNSYLNRPTPKSMADTQGQVDSRPILCRESAGEPYQ